MVIYMLVVVMYFFNEILMSEIEVTDFNSTGIFFHLHRFLR